ncbi:MAG: cofactor-independent phosphoglycerate mutase [Pseudomonadota bacterium]
MKYVILVGDGMGDYPIPSLGDKTPLEASKTPNMDWIADHGELGLAATIPSGCEAGSDTANLTLLGYDPRSILSGRGPLEAASLGIKLEAFDVAFRCNLVTLASKHGALEMNDYSAGHISSADSRVLIQELDRALGNNTFQFFPGVGYRHILVWRNGKTDVETTPPHDITGKPVKEYLDRLSPAPILLDLIRQAHQILADHPVNKERINKGEKSATDIWPWGQGHPLKIQPFHERFGLRGGMISAVDLLKGIAISAGLEVITVPGATGYLDTNYAGKADYCLRALDKLDFIYLHVEAPDEASHNGSLQDKVQAIEAFDEHVVGRVLKGLRCRHPSEFRVMVVTDHYTPITLMTHTREPVPFAMFATDRPVPCTNRGFNEKSAANSSSIANGAMLMERLASL